MTDSDRRREQGATFADGELPPALRPTTHETLRDARGDVIEVPKARLAFRRWTGALPGDRYGGKPILDWHGAPVFAELAILRILEAHGWGGVWVDSFRRKYRVRYWGIPTTFQLPPEREALVAAIRARLGTRYSCWDVYAWKGNVHLFVESKWKDRDRIRPTQVAWLRATQTLGLPDARFLIVEWCLDGSPQNPGQGDSRCS